MQKLRCIKPILLFYLSATFVFLFLYSLPKYPSTGYYQDYMNNGTAATYLQSSVYSNTLYQNGSEDAVHQYWDFNQPCRAFPSTKDIVVVMKTGATEAYEKMPTQLLTSMQCIPDLLLFSDLEQQMGKYHIYNVLDRVEDTVMNNHQEFRLYQAQQNCPISQKECTKGLPGGWDLDKYKFTNMVVRTWEMRPKEKWYVFVEADTYVVWPNLIKWLKTEMNPADDIYVGGIAFLGDLPFAHGGTGYVISGTLLDKVVEYIRNDPYKFDDLATRICCGDALLSRVIDDLHVSVQGASPMFNGEKPNTLRFGPRNWCQPLFTMHHMNSEEVSSVWQYEQTRTKLGPLQIRDIYHALVAPNMVSRRSQWNNQAEQKCFKKGDGNTMVEKQSHESPEACARVCLAQGVDINADEFNKLENDVDRDAYLEMQYQNGRSLGDASTAEPGCFQWRYREETCCTSDTFQLGYPTYAHEEIDAISGWSVGGIERWIDEFGQCQDGIHWVMPVCVGQWCQAMMEQTQEKVAEQKPLDMMDR